MISQNTSSSGQRPLFIALLALIVWIPLPHGGELPWQHTSFAFASLLLLSIWLFRHWQTGAAVPDIIRYVRLPLTLLLCWLVYVFIQAIPLPKSLLAWLNPAALAYFESAQNIGNKASYSLSIDSGSTLIEALKYSSYLATFFLTLVLCNSTKRLKILATALFLTGAGLSLYSLVNHYTNGAFSLNNPIPPWGQPWAKITRGTFSHQNHFAGFLAMTLPVGMGLLYSLSTANSNINNWRKRITTCIDLIMSVKAVYGLLLASMVTALLFTASRGGNTAFLAGIFIASILCLIKSKQRINIKKSAVIPIALLFALFTISATGITSGLTKRLEDQGFNPNGRDSMRTAAYKIIRDYPVFGSGAGTYPRLQHQYKSPDLGVTAMSKRAHNDYLEILTDQGIVGFVLLVSGLLLLLYKLLKPLGKTRHRLSTGLLWGASSGISAILVHSLAEFNFQIPANAVYFFLLLAIGCIISFQHQEKAANTSTP
ncbi:MAG: O-antigen ligase family protein [Flavobacteriales bacterium]|nr:O-antigen ligase family protein [Flavobacteriales bacterium]